MNKTEQFLLRKTFWSSKRMALYERMADYLQDGISLVETLEKFQAWYSKLHDSRAKIIGEWLHAIYAGENFQAAVAPWIDPTERMLIDAGEKAGDLVTGLREAAYINQARRKIRSTVIGALVMPAVLFAAFIGLLVGLSNTLVPKLEGMLPIEQWPEISLMYRAMAVTVRDHGIMVGLVFVGMFAFALALQPRLKRGKLRAFLDHLPPFSLYRTIQSSSFLVSLSSQLRAGVPVETGIQNIAQISTPWARSHAEEMLLRIARGEEPGTAMNTGMMEKELAMDVQAYAETSSFSAAISKIGKRLVERTLYRVKAVSNGINMLAIVSLGALIIWTLIAFGSVIMELTDQLERTGMC